MTREPDEPLTDDQAARPADADDIGTWEAADEETGAPAVVVEDAGVKDDLGPEVGLVIHPEPIRLSHMMIAVAVLALLFWFWVTLGGVAIALTIIGAIVMAVAAGFVTARLRSSRQEALLALLAIAVERRVPLAPAISAFADQFRGRAHRRTLNIVADLNAGDSLPDALARPPRAVSRDALLLARIGQETGRMAEALRMAGHARATRVTAWSTVVSRLSYLLVLMIFAENISGFLLYFIVPKLESIFFDFGLPLPALTIFLIETSHLIVRFGFITFLIYLFQILLLIFLPFSFGGWVNYQVPFFDRLFARRHTALVLRALALVIDSGRPIGVGLDVLSKRYPARWVRRRLAAAEKQVRGGDDWIEALWKAGVIRRSDAELLASASTVGNLAWACRELAETAERRQQIRIQLLIQMLFPLAILVIGLAVAVLCLGYFVPLVTLIERLTG